MLEGPEPGGRLGLGLGALQVVRLGVALPWRGSLAWFVGTMVRSLSATASA